LVLILLIIFVGLLRGSKDVKDAHLFAVMNQPFFVDLLANPLRHGMPDPTTISRAMAKLDPDTLVPVYPQFLQTLGLAPDDGVLSYDGKTMRGVSETDSIRHILSFFSHASHQALGQIGVDGKGREIPAFEELLKQGETSGMVAGKLLLGDALHTQKATVKAILKVKADYLFVVKGNQKQLKRAIISGLTKASTSQLNYYSYTDTSRRRNVTTMVTVLTATNTATELLPALMGSDHWDGVRSIGMLERSGTRTTKDGTVHALNETVGLISSRRVTAEAAATHITEHWCIENNLHWVKDVVFNEDRHTLKTGNAPQIMSWLRSMVISLCNALKLRSISDTIHNLEKSTILLGKFLRMAAVI
jgi:predicted transposase YbfD/YdcC